MITHTKSGLMTLVCLLCFAVQPAHAEVGDYSSFKSMLNLIFPPSANDPVNEALEQRLSFLPMIENPRDFQDGFNPKVYKKWQTVKLSENTGAMCGDGSPYEFYVNRSNTSSNMVIFFEGGGLCWDQDSCTKQLETGIGAVSTGGMAGGVTKFLPGALKPLATVSSIATSRIQPGFDPKSEDWTMAYLPYCTQDHHAGDSLNVYAEVDPANPVIIHHRGMRNQGAVIAWLKSNLEKPEQLLLSGQSAGGFASQALYYLYRVAMNPQKGYLLNDAGPIFVAERNGSKYTYPSAPRHNLAAGAFNLHAYFDWMEQESTFFSRNNLSSITGALANSYPQDRFGIAIAQEDHIYSGFSYNTEFEELFNEPDLQVRNDVRNQLRRVDMVALRAQLDQHSNFGYFAPGYRDLLGGHVLTLPLEAGARNEDTGVTIRHFFYDVLGGSGSVMSDWESSIASDYGRYKDPVNYIYRELAAKSDGDIGL